MSRERARRREARQAERDMRRLERERRDRRLARSRRLRSLAGLDRRARRRRGGRGRPWTRRSRGQRATIVGSALAVQALTWLLTPDWTIRLAVLLLTVLAVPALATATYDRSDRGQPI